MIKNIKLVVTIKELREILNHNFKDLDHRKIEKVEGLGLSTNDFSDAYKLKLDNIESGAQANDIETISLDGKILEITNKQVEIHQPVYSLIENPQPSENNFKEYNLTIDGEVTGLTIEVPKDIFLDKCTLEKVTVENEPYEGSKIGDAFLQLELNDGTVIYTPVTELQYHAGQDIVIDENNTISTIVPIPRKLSELENDNFTVTDENYVHTDNNFTDEYVQKIADLEDGIGEGYDELSEKIGTLESKVDTNKTETDETVANLEQTLTTEVGNITTALEGKADKATTLAGYEISDAYTKEEVDAKVSSLFRYKGTVDSYADLPTENLVVGDTYNVKDTGANYAWNGEEWDKLSETIDLTPYLTKESAKAIYATKESVVNKVDKEDGKSLVLDSEIERLSTLSNYDDTELQQKVAGKQDKLTAGTGIEISEDNVITSVQAGVSWGNINGDINNQTDLIDTLGDKQDKLVAGVGIEISDDNVISSIQSGVTWGNITGDITNQNDLQASLDTRASQLDYADSVLSIQNSEGEVLDSVTIKSAPDVDEETISFNDSAELQTIGVRTVDGTYKKEWIGTTEEYIIAVEDGVITENTQCIITDDEQEGLVLIPNATTSTVGLVKADGTTILVDEDGTIHALGSSTELGTTDFNALENKPKINSITLSGDKTANELGLASTSDLARRNPRLVEGANIVIKDNDNETQTISATLPENALTREGIGQEVNGSIAFKTSEEDFGIYKPALAIDNAYLMEVDETLKVGFGSDSVTGEMLETIVTDANASDTIPYANDELGGIVRPDNRTTEVDESGYIKTLPDARKQDKFRAVAPLSIDRKLTAPIQGLTIANDSFYPAASYRSYYYNGGNVYTNSKGTVTLSNLASFNISIEEDIVYEISDNFINWWFGELETTNLQFLPRLAVNPALSGITYRLIPDNCIKTLVDSEGNTQYYMYGNLGNVEGLKATLTTNITEGYDNKTYMQVKTIDNTKHLYFTGHNTDSTVGYTVDLYGEWGTEANKIINNIDTIGMNINFDGVGVDFAKTGWSSLVKCYCERTPLSSIENLNDYNFGDNVYTTPNPEVRSSLKLTADFNSYVDKTTNQTITGVKTFNADINVNQATVSVSGSGLVSFPSSTSTNDGINRLTLSASGTSIGDYKGTVQGNSLELYANDPDKGSINFRFLGKDTKTLTVEGSDGKFPVLNTSSLLGEGTVTVVANEDGSVTINGEEIKYELPIASEEILGGIKIGRNLEINSDGVLSALGIEEMLPENVLLNDKFDQTIAGYKGSVKLQSLHESGNLFYPLSIEEPNSRDFLNLGFNYDHDLILTRDNGITNPNAEMTLVSDKNISNYL
jgi:hypothetical protein